MRLSHQSTIYRGISMQYKDFPFTASAMRFNDIKYLESEFANCYGQSELNNYKNKINSFSQPQIPFFTHISTSCAWSWFLSLIHIAVEVKLNPELMSKIQYPEFISTFENYTKTDNADLPEVTLNLTNSVFNNNPNTELFENQAFSYTTVSGMVYGLELYQHLNYDLRKKGMNYNPFPTMVMDWTEDISIANDFSNNVIVLSIEYDNYINLIYNKWYESKMDIGISSYLPGFSPYFDFHSYFAKGNINIQRQKGIILFWPWSYTISELETNDIGKILGFKKYIVF